MKKKIYIIAGEASGDLHGSNLIKSLLQNQADLEIRFWGGDEMQKSGGKLVKHIRDLAFMGFTEVLMNIGTIFKNISFCKQDILNFQPDAVIFIDYPGFNLRIADWLKKEVKLKNCKSIYYISPQIWAWKESRVHKIKKVVDKMLVILPFEKDFYAKHKMESVFVGHPLIDAINNYQTSGDDRNFKKKIQFDSKPILALLPGSRKQEISLKLPLMLEAVKTFSDYQIVIAGAPAQDEDFYPQFLKGSKAKIVFNETYSLLKNANLACVTSGTATLETALFKVPQVVCYKGSSISYQIAKRLIKVAYISLVNLIMDKKIVVELIQNECKPENIRVELQKLEKGSAQRKTMLDEYDVLIEKLGGGGASEIVAKEVLKTISNQL